MPTVTYVEHDGSKHELDIAAGTTVMQGAIDNGLRGILADCGGACACATCHVYVDAAWADKVDEKSEMEEIMLEEVFDPKETSRLSCQITISDEVDGLVVNLPERQV